MNTLDWDSQALCISISVNNIKGSTDKNQSDELNVSKILPVSKVSNTNIKGMQILVHNTW